MAGCVLLVLAANLTLIPPLTTTLTLTLTLNPSNLA